jgi:hypothetical protein
MGKKPFCQILIGPSLISGIHKELKNLNTKRTRTSNLINKHKQKGDATQNDTESLSHTGQNGCHQENKQKMLVRKCGIYTQWNFMQP